MGTLVLASALLVVLAASEVVLSGTRLQTGLSRVLLVWTVVYLSALYALSCFGGVGFVPFTIFWGGVFLSWFGVRSHIESSILLRMLFLLRKRPMTERALVSEYMSLYGETMRREELVRGGLVVTREGVTSISPKGSAILSFVDKFR